MYTGTAGKMFEFIGLAVLLLIEASSYCAGYRLDTFSAHSKCPGKGQISKDVLDKESSKRYNNTNWR
jgi:hypothetical protein